MYHEEAVVKEYSRKEGRPNKQLNLGVNSRFEKGDKVTIISSSNIETFKQNLEPQNKELENNIAALTDENKKLKENLIKVENEKNNIIEENKEIIKTANENLIDAKDKLIANEKVIAELQRQHAEEMKEINKELQKEKDTSKTLLLALYSYEERGIINGFFNRTPELAKQILKENPKPIDANKKE